MGFLLVTRLHSPFPRCMFSPCRSKQAWACVTLSCLLTFLPRVGRALTLFQRSFVGGGSLAHLAQFPPLDTCVLGFRSVYMYIQIFIQTYKPSVFVCRALVAYRLSLESILLLPSACVPRFIAALLAPFSSAVSCHCFPVGLLLLPVVPPFHVTSAGRSFARQLKQTWPPTRSALGRRDVHPLRSVFFWEG